MTNNKNIALIGAGYWGKNLLRVFNELKTVKRICDIDPEIIKIRKKEYPKIEMSDSLKDILNDKEITAVVIAVPADAHYYLTKKFLEKGKDVLVEKPFTLKLKQAKELVEIAKDKKKILMVDHLFLYHPALEKIKELIRKKEIGEIYYFNSCRLNLGIIRDKENALWSIAPHDISLIIGIMEEMPKEVCAEGEKYLSGKNIDFSSASLKFKKNNIIANFFVSWLNPEKERKLVVAGSRGMIVFDDMAKDRLKLYKYKVEKKRNRATGYLKIEAKKTSEKSIKIADEEPLKNLAKHFLDCVESRKPPKSSGEEAIKVMRILEACQRSIIKKGKTIKI